MKIAQASKASQLSIGTIRYYEKAGILPNIERGKDGQRRFSPENIDWLILLYWLRETGMPMKIMHQFAALYRDGNHTVNERKAILLNHSEKLKQRRLDLDRCEEILSYKISLYKEFKK